MDITFDIGASVIAEDRHRSMPGDPHESQKRAENYKLVEGVDITCDFHRALGIVLLHGPRGVLFPMREVPL